MRRVMKRNRTRTFPEVGSYGFEDGAFGSDNGGGGKEG